MKQATILLVLLLGAFSCETTEPPPPTDTQIQLGAIDASCTEVWLEVKLPADIQPRTFSLRRDTSMVLSTTLVGSETLIVDEGLLPNRQYVYAVNRAGEIATRGITTLDTTSHEFVWKLDTLDEAGASRLYDVAIVNDTLAYAVGEMYLRDSLGQLDPVPYSIAVWNGLSWRLKRLCYGGINLIVPIRGIFVVSASDVWLAAGSVFRWDGASSQAQLSFSRLDLPVPGATIEKLWGSGNSNLYGVGNVGAVVHRHNNNWEIVESGTDVNLNDVWGGSNPWVGENSALIAAGNKFTGGETKLIRISTTGVIDSIGWPYGNRPRHSVWFQNAPKLFTCGSGVFTNAMSGWQQAVGIPAQYTNRIRGTALNNIFVAGDFGVLAHFNGMTWHVYPEVYLGDGNYESVAVREDLIIAVGWQGGRAIVLNGTRSPR